MNLYEHRALNSIKEAFLKEDIDFSVKNYDKGSEEISLLHSIECGSQVKINFISLGDGSDIGMRIWGLIRSTPDIKRSELIEVCNEININYRYLVFNLNEDWINVEYDFLNSDEDNNIGEKAIAMLRITYGILDKAYRLFMKALHSSSKENGDDSEFDRMDSEKVLDGIDLFLAINKKRYLRSRILQNRW